MPETDYFPEFSNYLPTYNLRQPAPATAPSRPLPADVPATGTGDWFTSALGAGFHGLLSEGARAAQAGAQLVGATDTAQSLSDFAEAHHAAEQSYARPDLEDSWSPTAIAYKIARMVPQGLAIAGGTLAGAALAPEAAAGAGVAALARAALVRRLAGTAGAAATLFPSAAGENVQRQISETGELTSPGTALALGVPEAAVQAWLPGHLEKYFGRSILQGIAHSAAVQGVAGGATEAMTQLMGDPDRSTADRASAVVSQALVGGALGGLVGGVFGGIRALTGKPAQTITIPALDVATRGVDPSAAPTVPVAPVVPTAPITPEQLQLPLPRVPEGLQDLPLFAQRPAGEPAAPTAAAPVVPAPEMPRGEPAVAATVPVLDFTARVTERALKEGMAQVAAAPAEAQAAMKQQLIDTIIARGDKKLTKGLEKWGQAFDILTPEGELKDELIPKRPPEVPPGVTPEVPPPPADTVRFYHGSKGDDDDPTSGGPRWVTPSEDYARNFRAVGQPNQVHYVDIPREQLGAGYDEINKIYQHFEAPENIAKQLKPLEPPVAPGERIGFSSAGATRTAPPGSQAAAAAVDRATRLAQISAEAAPSAEPAPVAPNLEAMSVSELKAELAKYDQIPVGNKANIITQIKQARLRDIRFQNKIAPEVPGTGRPTPAGSPSAEPEAPVAPAKSSLAERIAASRAKEPATTGSKARIERALAKPIPLDANLDITSDETGRGYVVTADGGGVSWHPTISEAYAAQAAIRAKRLAEPAPTLQTLPAGEPVKTADDRAAALNAVQAQIAKLTNPEAKAQHTAEARNIAEQLPLAEGNSGLVPRLNARIDNLRAAVDAAGQRPGDQLASSDLAPSPHAEAVPESVDLGKAIGEAQSALANLKTVLPGAKAVTALRDKWLADINKTNDPAKLAKLLENDPETVAANDETGTVLDWPAAKDLNKVQQQRIDAYLNAQQRVRQALETSKDPDARARVISSRDGLPVTQLDADVTDHARRGVSAVDAADHLIEHTPNPEDAALVAKLRAALLDDVKLVFRDGVTDKEGEYFPKQKTIAIYNAADAAKTFIHEMTHAVTHEALEGDSAAAEAVRGIYDQLKSSGDHAGITDAHEMVAEAFSNPIYRDYLRSKFVKGTSLWDRFVDTVRGFIGLDPRLYNAFDRIMSLGDDLMKEQQQYPNDWVGPDSYARVANRGTKAASNGADQGEAATIQRLAQGGKLNVEYAIRNNTFGLIHSYRIARLYGHVVESMQPYVDALTKVDTRDSLLSKASQTAYDIGRALPKDVQALMHEVQSDASSYGMDPRKPAIQDNPDRLKLHQELNAKYSQLINTKGGEAGYEMQRASASADTYKLMAYRLQALAQAFPDANIPNPFDEFHEHPEIWTDPRKVEAYFKKAVADGVDGYARYRDQLANAASKTGLMSVDDLKELEKRSNVANSTISPVLKEIATRQAAAEEAPYFHQGRNGNFFNTAKLALDAEGKVDKEKLAQLSEFLDREGHTGIAIKQGGQHDTIYVRVQSPSETNALHQSLLKAQEQGLLSQEEAPASGEAAQIFPLIATDAMRKVLAALPEPDIPSGLSNADDIRRAFGEQKAELQRTLLNTMSENSIGRILARRANVQGFAKDMSENSLFASKVVNRGLAHMTVAPEIGELMKGMSDQVKDLNRNSDAIKSGLNLAASQAVGELMLRDRLRTAYVAPTVADGLRHVMHDFSVGSSPKYFLTLMSQLLTTTLPELIKTHGYVQGTQAFFKVMPEAMRVMRATLTGPDWATAGMSQEALEGKVAPATVNKMTRMISSGAMGPMYSTQMTQHSPLGHYISPTVLKAAEAMGRYAELFPRVVSGLAAHELYNIKPYIDPLSGKQLTRDQFVSQMVDESQGRWTASLNARQLTKGGSFGPMAPFMNQFMGWQVIMGGKIYNEIRNMFDAKSRSEATRWLIGHGAATTMLAGTLGLPALSVAASVYDRLMDWVTNRDDHDLTASYRGFLSDTFGKDMGEIIARGLPRAAGMDFANFGEANIFPGSATVNMLFEKRKLEDAERDWLKSLAGPGVGELANFAAGIRDMSNGDYLNGLIKMSPEILKSPAEAWRLHERGFVNNLNGQQLPISGPNAFDIMMTALGIDPAKQAEYQEVTREETGLRTMRQLNSSNIVRHLEQAYMRGDRGMLDTWMAEAQKWQVDHPGLMPPQADFQRELETHIRASAQAQGMGLPIGVTPRDVGARGALRYGNFPVQ